MINETLNNGNMKIRINKVEGSTNKRGSKQNNTLQILNESTVNNFYSAKNDAGKKFTIWNVNGDWSKIGIRRKGHYRYTYTDDFIIL